MACQLSTSVYLTSALSSMFSPSSLLGSNSSQHQTGHLPHIKPGDFDTSACVASSVSPAGPTGILNVGSRKESRQSEFFNIFSPDFTGINLTFHRQKEWDSHQKASERFHALHERNEASGAGRVHVERVCSHQPATRSTGETTSLDIFQFRVTDTTISALCQSFIWRVYGWSLFTFCNLRANFFKAELRNRLSLRNQNKSQKTYLSCSGTV